MLNFFFSQEAANSSSTFHKLLFLIDIPRPVLLPLFHFGHASSLCRLFVYTHPIGSCRGCEGKRAQGREKNKEMPSGMENNPGVALSFQCNAVQDILQRIFIWLTIY